MELNYGTYLKLDELLDLQKPQSTGPEHDETLFIIIHQVYELWFKQQLHEADLLGRSFEAGDAPVAAATLGRMLTILKTMVAQVDILETMTPISFLSFREFLASSSGFQSAQFRAFEFALGHKRQRPLDNYDEDSSERAMLEARLATPSVWAQFIKYLLLVGVEVPEDLLTRPTADPTEASEALQRSLIEVYRTNPPLRSLCELLVDLDEGVQEWRYRHVKMVERTIGFKKGTGGSPGIGYLRETLFRPLFPDLWAIRSEL